MTTTKQVKIYTTAAECYRDIHEVYSALLEQTGLRISPNITHDADGGCAVEFIVHQRVFDKLNDQSIKDAICSVADAGGMNDNMVVETYEFPLDWYVDGVSYFDGVPATPENIRNNYTLIGTSKFGKEIVSSKEAV